MEILQQPQQQVITTYAKRTYVLCPLNLNKVGWGALAPVQNCASCAKYSGIVTYKDNIILPRLLCFGSGTPKLLEFYTSCRAHKRCVKCSKFCARCAEFTSSSFDLSDGYIKCAKAKRPKVKTAFLLPQKTPKIEYPFPISCAKTNTHIVIDSCLHCIFFKGLSSCGGRIKVSCTHSQAVKSEHVVVRSRCINTVPKRKQPKQINLSWLFEEKVKTISLRLKVGCILDNTLQSCRECVDHSGVLPNFTVHCNTFLHPAIYTSKCPRVKSPVLLGVCVKCSCFGEIRNDRLRCAWTKIQNYVTKEPKKTKFYYDFGD